MRIFFILLVLLLTACQSHKFNYFYLMTHPKTLKQQVVYCRDPHETPAKQAYCETVMYAAANFMSLTDEADAHPQQFGERILKAQEKMVQMASILNEVQQQGIKEKIATAEKAYQEQQEEVATLLAVVGMEEIER